MPVRLRNLTPHTVTIQLTDETRRDLPAETPTPRCETARSPLGTMETQIGAIAVVTTRLLPHVADLPDPVPGTWLLVARQVAQACPDRDDLLFPEDLIREPGTGRVVGCRALGRLSTELFT